LFNVRRGGLPERVLVVEGYMDAAALYQYGFDNAVATLGTSVTPEHMQLLFRAAPVVVFCFDGDRAGTQAAWRGLEAALAHMQSNREVRFLFLPDGEDPDSLIRARGARAFSELLDRATPMSTFFFEHLAESLDLSTLDGRARLVGLAEPYLDKLPEGAFADLMREELRQRTGHAGHAGSARRAPARPRAAGPDEDRSLTPVQYAVALLVQRPSLAAAIEPDALDGPASIRGLDFLRELIDFCRNKPHLSPAMLLEAWRERREAPWLARLAAREVINDPEAMPTAMTETLARIRRLMVQARIRELQQAQMNEGGLDEARTSELRRLLGQRSEDRPS
jgi:DNA primase